MADGESDVDYANLIRAQTRQVDIDAFKERGMKKVNVINAKKINEMISQAVTNIIGRMESADIQTMKDDKAQIVMDSMAEFKRLFAEQKKEAEGQGKLQEEIGSLREMLTQRDNAPAASSVQSQQISDEIAELKAFMINQASRAQSSEMTRGAMMEQQAQLLEDHFNDLKAALATGGNVAAQQAVADDNTKKALEEVVEKVTVLLEDQDKRRNGTTTDALMAVLTDLKQDLGKRFDDLTGAIKHANTDALKTEISALRDDLAAKTVAAGAANTEALQAQLAKMEEMMAKGGGGGGFSGDLNDIVSKLEGSMNKKFAEAGIGKEEVSMDDAVAVSGVMLGAAFKGMDDIESNIGALDARKSTDKEGGKKAKGALDALKKLKGKG
ncbi:MAG: hypothetical protein IT464_02335 [Planctomycetes bacterium]|nr:hypothetical protein [Planctomycetota bacterium]